MLYAYFLFIHVSVFFTFQYVTLFTKGEVKPFVQNYGSVNSSNSNSFHLTLNINTVGILISTKFSLLYVALKPTSEC